MTDQISDRVSALEDKQSFAQQQLSSRLIRTNQITAMKVITGAKIPYVQMDANGVMIVNGLAGAAALRLENDPTSTITEIRECEGGLAVSSDQTDVVKFQIRDTAFGVGATNLRFNLQASGLETRLELYDNADAVIARIRVTAATGAVEIESLGAGDLTLRSATAQVNVEDDLEPYTDDTYYLGDYQKGWKGIMVKDDADGFYYKITSHNGAVTITKVTS